MSADLESCEGRAVEMTYNVDAALATEERCKIQPTRSMLLLGILQSGSFSAHVIPVIVAPRLTRSSSRPTTDAVACRATDCCASSSSTAALSSWLIPFEIDEAREVAGRAHRNR